MQQAEWFLDDVPADSPLFADLNPTQREAVAATEGPVVVVAGAGSGKTRVLTYRIAHLMRDLHVAPDSILAITFTNKAATEMKERVGALVGGMVRFMWVSTFHSACVRILRREASRLGYKSAFTIYDDADALRLLRMVTKDLDLETKRFPEKAMKGVISKAKNELVDYESFADQGKVSSTNRWPTSTGCISNVWSRRRRWTSTICLWSRWSFSLHFPTFLSTTSIVFDTSLSTSTRTPTGPNTCLSSS